MCDERDSQLSNGWLRKVGVLIFCYLDHASRQLLADYPVQVSHDPESVAGG